MSIPHLTHGVCLCLLSMGCVLSGEHDQTEELQQLRKPLPAFPVPMPFSSTVGRRSELIKTFMWKLTFLA